ncbi:hypothetical protein [Streptomyces bikiniensis]|uniref:hypothetical protein n=1 Tax=Streptomyces bikiniensis TaxID=1896 RepID=UPI0004C1A92E|nr:hypothetical protein [Streptomyces bikiniensis]
MITPRALNRSTLARQLLLGRKRIGVEDALRPLEQVEEDADGGEGEDEVAQEAGGHQETGDALGAHCLATPLATRATGARTAIVVAAKAASAIVTPGWRGSRPRGAGRRFSDGTRKTPPGPSTAPVDGPLTPYVSFSTPPVRSLTPS